MWPPRAPTRLATSCLVGLPDPSGRRHAPPRAPLTPLPMLIPSTVSLPRQPSRARRHRSPLPHPQPSPRLSDVTTSSATTSSSSPSSHAAPEALLHLQRRRSRPRAPVIPTIVSPDPVPPLPRQQHQKNRGEPLHRFPLASLRDSPPSRINHQSRPLPAAGHVAAAVATPARRTRARRRAQRFLRKPQTPPVRLETRCSA